MRQRFEEIKKGGRERDGQGDREREIKRGKEKIDKEVNIEGEKRRERLQGGRNRENEREGRRDRGGEGEREKETKKDIV